MKALADKLKEKNDKKFIIKPELNSCRIHQAKYFNCTIKGLCSNSARNSCTNWFLCEAGHKVFSIEIIMIALIHMFALNNKTFNPHVIKELM